MKGEHFGAIVLLVVVGVLLNSYLGVTRMVA